MLSWIEALLPRSAGFFGYAVHCSHRLRRGAPGFTVGLELRARDYSLNG